MNSVKKGISIGFLLLIVCSVGGCGIFGGGCKCPKVSYNAYPKR